MASLAFAVSAIVSMSFTQLGFWCAGTVDDQQLYLMPLLAPIVCSAFAFGPLTGALLGLFAGAVVYAHSVFFPLDFYEIYFMTPLNTFVLLTFVGLAAGWLYDRALHSRLMRSARSVRIILVSLMLSVLASVLVQLNIYIAYGVLGSSDAFASYLLSSPKEVALQALADAAFIAVLCLVADFVIHYVAVQGAQRKLRTVFGGWMLLVSLIVFMLTSAVIFSVATVHARSEAETNMVSEARWTL